MMTLPGVIKLCLRLSSVKPTFHSIYRCKTFIDYSKFPKIGEEELKEQFIKGSGPGGSKVNKTSNCVLLKHIPSGIVVKCHESRLLQRNRELARDLLLNRLDDLYNGEMSVSAQKKRIGKLKLILKQNKQKKLRELKKKFLLDSDTNKTA